MDVRSYITLVGLMISLSSAVLTPNSFANVNAETNSEDRFWINRSHQNLAKVNNFQGTLAQTLPNKIQLAVSDVFFQTPNNFYQIITQPESLKGFEASYHNNTIKLHDSLNKQALTIKGLEPYKKSSSLDQVKGIYMYNQEKYEQEFTPSIHVSDRLSVGIDFKAKEDNLAIKKVEAFVDYHYSLMMQSNLILNNGTSSKTSYTSMILNSDSFSLPNIGLPKDTKSESWNFNNKHLSKKKVTKKINKNIVWPEDENDTWGFSEYKFYQQGNNNTAAAYYYSDNFFLITLTRKSDSDKNNSSVPLGLGIPLELEGTPTQLNQFPAFSNLEFDHKGIHYTLLSNTHPESLLSMAKNMLKPIE